MRRVRCRRIALAAWLAAVPSTGRASCVWSDLVRDEARVAAIRSDAARTYFVQDDVLVWGCPDERPACRERAFLVTSDVVLTGPTQGRYTCSGYIGTKGPPTIGWLPGAALAPLPEAEQAPTDWGGHWVAPEQDVTIAPGDGDTLTVKGEATWGDNPGRRRTGGVHTGELAGVMRLDRNILAFTMGEDGRTRPYAGGDEFTCRVRMMRRGPYLLVRDNNACGGVNVTFSGFYRRTP